MINASRIAELRILADASDFDTREELNELLDAYEEAGRLRDRLEELEARIAEDADAVKERDDLLKAVDRIHTIASEAL